MSDPRWTVDRLPAIVRSFADRCVIAVGGEPRLARVQSDAAVRGSRVPAAARCAVLPFSSNRVHLADSIPVE